MNQDAENEPQTDADAAPAAAVRHEEPETASIHILKAMANPVRQRLERALSRRGHARAADLAEDLGLPANQVSFHLRVLADAGLIEEAAEFARDRRDRVWKPVKRTFTLGNPKNPVPDERLGGIVMQSMAAEVHDILQRVLVWGAEYTTGRTSGIHGDLVSGRFRFTESEWIELMDRIHSTIAEFEEQHEGDRPGVRTWDLRILAADDTI